MFWGIFGDFISAPISPSQLGLPWRCRGAPRRSRSAPKTVLDALRAATAAAPKPILAKEARRYATHGQTRCQSWRFLNYFCFCGRKGSIFALLFNILCDSGLTSIFPPPLGLLWRCWAAPWAFPDAFRTAPECSWTSFRCVLGRL